MADVVKNSSSSPPDSLEESVADSSQSPATDDTTSPNKEQSSAENQPDRNRIVLLAYCIFFTLLLGGQYLWLYFDKPEPIQWERGKAFESFRVDVNNATWVDWIQLPGIGQTTAERILGDIDHNGPFKSIDELTRVNGIGPKTLERIRPWLTISPRRPERTP